MSLLIGAMLLYVGACVGILLGAWATQDGPPPRGFSRHIALMGGLVTVLLIWVTA